MKKWILTSWYIPATNREVLVRDRINKRYDICYYDKNCDDNYEAEIEKEGLEIIDPILKKWVNRNGERVVADFWRELISRLP